MLLASACGSSAASNAPISHASTHPEPTDPAQVAQADAAKLLSAFVPPPNATAATSEPNGTPAAMNAPGYTTTSSAEVDRTGWWIVDTPANTVYSWLKTRLPSGAGTYGGSPTDTTGATIQFVMDDKPATNLLGQRTVMAAVGSLSATRTVLRVDAQVVYRPAKPAAELVPVTAYLLATVRPKRLPDAPSPSPSSVAVTDHSKIAEIAGLLNALPTRVSGIYHCPIDTGAGIYLTFETAADGATRATVALHLEGCGEVSVNIGGTNEPGLDPSDTTYPGGFSAHVARLLGISRIIAAP